MTTSWATVRLGEVLKHRKEFITIDDSVAYVRPRVQLHARGIVVRDQVPGAAIKTKKQQICGEGDFLVAEIDAKVGGYGMVPQELAGAIVSSHYFLFAVDEGVLDRAFLGHFVRTPRFSDQVKAQGSTNYAAIRPQDVFDYEMPLPPLAEQRRIVARIESAAARITEARKLKKQVKERARAVYDAAAKAFFTHEASQRWPKMTLGDVADIRAGVTLGRRLSGKTISLPYLRVANVQDGYLNLTHVKQVHVLESEIEKWKLECGDILLTEGGDWDKLGRGTVWRGEIPNCIHQNHIFRLRTNRTEFLPEFLAGLIGSPIGKAYFQEASKQTTNLASINQRQLKAFAVFQPSIAEQRRIVAALDAMRAQVDGLEDLQNQTAAELDALLPSILDKAFSGRL